MRTTLLCCSALFACAPTRAAGLPVLLEAPPPLAAVRVQVDARLDVSGYWARKGLGQQLVRALNAELAAALGKAGYQVDDRDPELVARISAQLAGSTRSLDSVTTLELLHRGRLLERMEVKSPLPNGAVSAEIYPELVAVTLVNAVSRSEPVLQAILHRSPRPADPERTILAVLDVADEAGILEPIARQQLGEYLAVEATRVMGVRVVAEGELAPELRAVTAESYRACRDTTCQIELGKALAAQQVLVSKLLRLGGGCVLTGTIYELRTEAALRAASIKTSCERTGLLEAADRLMEALTRAGLGA